MEDRLIKFKVQCPVCRGTGRVYLGERDPIEGNKMRSTGSCEACNSKGQLEVEISALAALAASVCALAELDDVKNRVAKAVDKQVTEIFNTWKKTL
jgi:C4-type Zn-finger protein